jgi:SAM-dependent methyltransferase
MDAATSAGKAHGEPAYGSSGHYGPDYFTWQNAHADIKARIKVERFKPYIRSTDTVLDFGSAGGAMLAGLPGTRKIGVEINDVARAAAEDNFGLEVYRTLDEVPDDVADVIVSNHTLEHLAAPLEALKQLRPKLRSTGRLVLVLPIDDWRPQRKWDPQDISRHLYTWTPMNLGNLLDEAGFDPQEMRIIHRTLMRGFETFIKLPARVFDVLSWFYSHARHRQELLAVAVPRRISG